jgi:hypothetical protein
MQSRNDAKNRRYAVANYFLKTSVLVAALATLLFTVISSTVNAQSAEINGNICSGGNHSPALISVTPPSSSTTIQQTTNIDLTLDWVDSVTIKRGSTVLGTASGTNTSNQILSIPVSLVEGTNNLTISLTGGCPTNAVNTSYAITFIENAATFTYEITNNQSPRLFGSYEPLGTKVFVTIEGSVYEATTRPDGTWELPAGTIAPDLAEGSYDVYIEQKDMSDAIVFSHTYTDALVIDTTAPMGSIISSHSGSRSPELSGTVSDPNATITIDINDMIYNAINNRDGTWTLPAGTIAPALASGDYEVIVTITDQAGNITNIRSVFSITAPNEIGFILAPNTGYIRIASINIPSWMLYSLLLFILAFGFMRRRQNVLDKSQNIK